MLVGKFGKDESSPDDAKPDPSIHCMPGKLKSPTTITES